MDINRLNRLKSLKNEVKEFHPVLNELFRRLPNITNVEYTHGPNEMGADFILFKHNEILSKTEYIGVIVKIGKISQNHSDVDEQIKECELERHIENGKKEIYLSEIWIITNDTISNPAKRKIHHKYKNKSIHFITGEDTTTLLNKFYPEYWTDISIEIGTYLREIINKSKNLTTAINLLDMKSYGEIHIKQYLINKSKEVYSDPGRKKTSKRIYIDDVLEQNNLILIEGTMGTGKSKLLSKLAEEYSKNETFKTTNTIPYILSIKDFLSDFNGNIDELIKLMDSSINLDGINYLIMIDALDEIKIKDLDKVEILNDIYSKVNTRDNCKVVITSRPFDDPSIDVKVDNVFVRFSILPLTVKQIVNLIDEVCQNTDIKTKFLGDLEKSHLFKVLPKTPISAIILAKLLSQDIQEIPSTMTELYSKYTELVLGRWDIDKGLKSQNEYNVIYNVTINLAKYILDHQLPCVSIDEVYDIFKEYTSSRKVKKINEEDLFNNLISNQEIFKVNNTFNTISFAHKTFAEFFYASHLQRDHAAIIDQEIYNTYWNNSYFFYFGLIKDSIGLVNALEEIKFTNEEAKISQMFTNGNLLLAAYLTPYETIEKSLIKSFKNSAQLFDDLINDRIHSPLLILPKAQLLALITYTMNSSYGYEFFMESLENRSGELSTKNQLTSCEYAELFLINNSLLSIKKFDSFDMMVDKYGKDIPDVFQIGISHSIEIKKYSPIVKKYIKNFYRKMKNNNSLRLTILDMYEKPINENVLSEIQKTLNKQKN